MRVALVHDFLLQFGGAEKVVEALHDMYPDAPLYTSAYDRAAMPAYYRDWDIRTTFLQRLPAKRRTHRLLFMFFPMAFESLDFSSYDLVISSSSAFAKGVITPPTCVHVCYTHAPARYAWSTQSYLAGERGARAGRWLLAPSLHYLRMWDRVAADRVDCYIANSSAVASRIAKYYRRDSVVVPPPVDTSRFHRSDAIGDYYILVSRFAPYKRIDLAVDAFSRLGRRLIVVGTGRQMNGLKARAAGCVEFRGFVDDAELPELMARARGYVMPGEEDFGIAPVEANACGRPVIAYAAGGAMDSQIDGMTGVLFSPQTVDALCNAVSRAEATQFDSSAIVDHARRFDIGAFQEGVASVVSRAMEQRTSGTAVCKLNGSGARP